MKWLPSWWRAHFLLCEGGVAVALTGAFAWWYLGAAGTVMVNALLASSRHAIYGTAASVLGSLLGFIITAASIIFAVSGSDRLKVVRDSKQDPVLWSVFSATIRACGLATVAAFIALIFDRDQKPMPWLLIIAVFGILLAILRIARAIWALERVIMLITASRHEERRGESWVKLIPAVSS
jgi:hypothetical protein